MKPPFLTTAVSAAVLVSLAGGAPTDPPLIAIEEACFTPPPPNLFDLFGWAIAMEGDTLAVGSFNDDDADFDAGAVYVYTRAGTSWTQQAKLLADDAAQGDALGRSVGLSGNTIVAGAAGDDSCMGAAYVFVRSGTTWTQEAKLVADDAGPLDEFGSSVAIEGDRIAVGATRLFLGPTGGAAYVFERTGSAWSQAARVEASDGSVMNYLGFSIALSGDTMIVGGPRLPTSADPAGAAYVFTRTGSTWSQEAKLVPSGPAQMGFSAFVDVDGDRAIGSGDGEIVVFERELGTWSQVAVIPNGGGLDLAGDRILAVSSGPPFGTYLFERDGSAWVQRLVIPYEGEVEFGRFSGALDGERIAYGYSNALVDDQVVGQACVFRVEDAECFLVIGPAPGWTDFTVGEHTFFPQVSEVADFHPVLMDVLPGFPLPTPRAGLGARNDLGEPGTARELCVQVLMWNPTVFPAHPEQWSHGLRVLVMADGSVLTRPYGESTGIEIRAEVTLGAQGERVLRFPFVIPGI